MGLFDVKRFINKIKEMIPYKDVVETLEKLPNDLTFNQISQNAGTVGGIFSIALHITEKAYQKIVPIEKRLSLTLIRIMIESARDSLPYSVASVKIDKSFTDDNLDEFENIVLELFESKDNTDEDTIVYLPDHPVFIKFRNLLEDAIKKYNRELGTNISIPRFLTEFNSNLLINLEHERGNNNDLEVLLRKWKQNTDFQRLSSYLSNARSMFFEPNDIDQKSLSEYYVENQTYIVEKSTWDVDEEQIERKKEWNLESFLASNE